MWVGSKLSGILIASECPWGEQVKVGAKGIFLPLVLVGQAAGLVSVGRGRAAGLHFLREGDAGHIHFHLSQISAMREAI